MLEVMEKGKYLVIDRGDVAIFYKVVTEGKPEKIAVWTTGVLWKENKEFIEPKDDEYKSLSDYPKMEEIFEEFINSNEESYTLEGDLENPRVWVEGVDPYVEEA